MTTPTPSASGAHTRIQLKRQNSVIVIHGTLETFDPNSGVFTAWLDTQPQGSPAGTYTPVDGLSVTFKDSAGLIWEVVR